MSVFDEHVSEFSIALEGLRKRVEQLISICEYCAECRYNYANEVRDVTYTDLQGPSDSETTSPS